VRKQAIQLISGINKIMKANDSRANRTNQSDNYSPGRPRAIPARLIPELLQRRDRGEGYRMLSRWLKRCGIDASPAACRRAALGQSPYDLYTKEFGEKK